MRRLVPVVAALFLLLPAGAAAQFQPRVVNGSPAAAGDLPWTVAVQTAGRTAFDGHFCGGTLVAPDRVLTAAHCVLATGPDEIEVFAGSADLAHKRPAAAPATYHAVEWIALHPQADAEGEPPRRDLALLGLTGAVSPAAPISPVNPFPAVGDDLRIAGWGVTDTGKMAGTLQWGDVDLLEQTSCVAQWGLGPSADDLFCAIRTTPDGVVDACAGDSGGPIMRATTPGDPLTGWRLAGVTSFGSDGCDEPDRPGAYARLDAFATAAAPIVQPYRTQGAPAVGGEARAGATVTCGKGDQAWSIPATTTALVRSYDDGGAAITHARAEEGTAAFAIRAGDVGRRFVCELRATVPAGGGYGVATATIGTAAPPQEPPPVITPVQPPFEPPVVTPPPRDIAAPRTTLIRRRCAQRRCTFVVVTSDPVPSSGVRTVRASLERSVRRRCGSRARRRWCTSVRRTTLRAVPAGARGFSLRTAPLARGIHTLVVRAVDAAGNVQRVPRRMRFAIR